MRLSSTVLGARDPHALARFYSSLLGWEIVDEQPGWVKVRAAGALTGLAFQEEADHVPPVWPSGPGDQQMQAHLDIGAEDLAQAEALALSLGAVRAEHQPQDDVLVLTDPEGHPFCLFALA